MIITNIYSFIVVWGTIKECPFKSNINTLISSPNSAITSYCTNPYNSGTQRNREIHAMPNCSFKLLVFLSLELNINIGTISNLLFLVFRRGVYVILGFSEGRQQL